MFETITALPADPLLGLMVAHAEDNNPNKVDLGVGVYRDDKGNTPIFNSVKKAEARAIAEQTTKSYIGPAGSADYNRLMSELLFGQSHTVIQSQRLAAVQTPGGCGALRVGAEFIKHCQPDTTIWVSDPTWPNHKPLLGDTGLSLASYPYFDKATRGINFSAMMACLEKVSANDVVLLHACCHNPSGADLNQEQWQVITQLAKRIGFTVYIDSAYQGFGQGLDEDAYGIRVMAEELPELIIASSCSKNFGLYRERTGSLSIVTTNTEQAKAVQTHINKIVRGIYSMPPSHGAAIVETLLGDEALKREWQQELLEVRKRVLSLRTSLANALQEKIGDDRFRFIENQQGMFSFLGLNAEQVKQMREQFSIYMAGDSRVNIAGLKMENVEYVAGAVASLIW